MQKLLLKTEFSRNSKIVGIYKIIFNDKVYIGSSVNIEQRLIKHRSHLKKGDHQNTLLQRYFNKYKNIYDIHFEIIHRFNEKIFDVENSTHINYLRAIECYFIEIEDPFFNFKSIFENSKYKKLKYKVASNAIKVHCYTLEGEYIESFISATKATTILFPKEKSRSSLISSSMRYEREGIARRVGNYLFSNELKTSVKPYSNKKWVGVDQYNLNGEFIKKFNSSMDAAIEVYGDKKWRSSITACTNGRVNTAKNFIWKKSQ